MMSRAIFIQICFAQYFNWIITWKRSLRNVNFWLLFILFLGTIKDMGAQLEAVGALKGSKFSRRRFSKAYCPLNTFWSSWETLGDSKQLIFFPLPPHTQVHLKTTKTAEFIHKLNVIKTSLQPNSTRKTVTLNGSSSVCINFPVGKHLIRKVLHSNI